MVCTGRVEEEVGWFGGLFDIEVSGIGVVTTGRKAQGLGYDAADKRDARRREQSTW